MTRTTKWLAVGSATLLFATGCAKKEDAPKADAEQQAEAAAVQPDKPQTICPVMGGKIDKNLYADVEGKRIYVCCEGCVAAVKKDPAKYIAQAKTEGVILEDIPK